MNNICSSQSLIETASIWNSFIGHICVCVCVCVKGTAVAQWFRRCAKNRKVAGSIPGGDNLSDRTMALGSTQPLTEMCARSFSWG